MTWILTQLVQSALRMLAVVAGIFFLGGWAWFAYFHARDPESFRIPSVHDGLRPLNEASVLPGGPHEPAPSEDADYARKVFGGLLPIEEVLASKASAESAPGCTYAIIRTGEDIARTPPTSALGTAWWERFGGEWRQSPERLFGELPLDALAECRAAWPDALGAELQAALDDPGNWYMRSASGADLHIFSAEGRLAARIRHGS